MQTECGLGVFRETSVGARARTHAHTHTHTYVRMYTYIYEYVHSHEYVAYECKPVRVSREFNK